jgi:hypothetical protein
MRWAAKSAAAVISGETSNASERSSSMVAARKLKRW